MEIYAKNQSGYMSHVDNLREVQLELKSNPGIQLSIRENEDGGVTIKAIPVNSNSYLKDVEILINSSPSISGSPVAKIGEEFDINFSW